MQYIYVVYRGLNDPNLFDITVGRGRLIKQTAGKSRYYTKISYVEREIGLNLDCFCHLQVTSPQVEMQFH